MKSSHHGAGMTDDDASLSTAAHIECRACHELNRAGSTRCARCGEVLPFEKIARADPELTSFDAAQVHERKERRIERLSHYRVVVAKNSILTRPVVPGIDFDNERTSISGWTDAFSSSPLPHRSRYPNAAKFTEAIPESEYVECAQCRELNPRVTSRCARCGEPLSVPLHESGQPELAPFATARADAVEADKRDRQVK
jgi:predicted amidophosphoribosyltransferase